MDMLTCQVMLPPIKVDQLLIGSLLLLGFRCALLGHWACDRDDGALGASCCTGRRCLGTSPSWAKQTGTVLPQDLCRIEALLKFHFACMRGGRQASI